MPSGIYPRPPRKPPTKRIVRTLRPGEVRPDGEPSRYPDRAGYVRLRWHVGPNEYVEIREHRAVLGLDAPHVHHRNRDTSDNRPENLAALTVSEHASLHGKERQKFDRIRAAKLYAAGLSTPELARVFGVHHVSVFRGLRAVGVTLRRPGVSARVEVDERAVIALYQSGLGRRAVGQALGIGAEIVERVLRERGVKPHRPGRQKGH